MSTPTPIPGPQRHLARPARARPRSRPAWGHPAAAGLPVVGPAGGGGVRRTLTISTTTPYEATVEDLLFVRSVLGTAASIGHGRNGRAVPS
ncbi:hypothetical protein I1A62_01795 (plasmid) [Rhodococcus sp. USK10]|uniref:hypothetical protein n=1 Tax=Rhodococcus sp. USK10 TaxID=2789739 RepID=UPI001C606E0D|nr:hypothetical protein [Rhodococcus sp. USK10]QYA99910.1 hypothetical protein I1A62_01795 [Rhodococcus sp. USK10]